MAKYLALIFAAAFIIGCTDRTDELEKQNAELRNKSSELSADLSSRDAYIDTVTQSINDIYANLEGMRSKEKNVVSETNALESGKKLTSREVRQHVLTQLGEIDAALKGNNQKLADLTKRMNSNRSQYAGLKKMVATLKQTIDEREASIATLQQKVTGLESDLSAEKQVVSE